MRVIAAALSLTCSLAWAFSYAWWVTARIEPQGTKYDGVPVGTLAIPLSSLTLLSCAGSTATFTLEQCADVEANSARFEASGDFNKDKKPDIARVGVAELKRGGLVRVLLIGTKNKPKQHQMFKLPENGFSALLGEDPLTWYQCMECGHGADIKWDAAKRKYVLEWGEDYG